MTERMRLKPNRIPLQWDDITPEWATAAIARQHPKARVKAVSVVSSDDGSNRRARLALTYANGTGPASVFLKSHQTLHRSVHLRNGNLFNEARLFASGVSLGIEHPVIYKSIVDFVAVNYLVVMEDLRQRDADLRDATRPMSVEQVANGLRGLARVHSRYWGFTNQTQRKLQWVKTWAPSEGWKVGLGKRIPTGLQRASGQLSEAVLKLNADQLVNLWARYVSSLTHGPMTLLHGDAHIGNSYVLPNGEVGFFDWQVVRRGEWSQDVGYFLVGSLTEADRRSSEKELIEIYRNALKVPESERPTKEQAWLRYRTTPAYGLPIWLSTMGTDDYQAPAISLALSQRFAAAFVELDTTAALASCGV